MEASRPLLPTTATDAAAAAATASTFSSFDGNDSDNGRDKEPYSSSSNNVNIILRLLFVSAVGFLSVWASVEASRGFRITVANDAADTPAGRRFHLLFVSNDEATRTILRATAFAEDVLFGGPGAADKRVSHVTLRLDRRNSSLPVTVEPTGAGEGEYTVTLSSALMEGKSETVRRAVPAAVLRGVSTMLLSAGGGQRAVSSPLAGGIVEYVSLLAGNEKGDGGGLVDSGEERPPALKSSGCRWGDKGDAVAGAHVLGCCARQERGFIRRLVRALEEGWTDRTVDNGVIRGPAQQVCAFYGPHAHSR